MECPYMEENHAECSLVLNMQHIETAFERCIGNYHQCLVYKQLRRKEMGHNYIRSVEVIDAERELLLLRHG